MTQREASSTFTSALSRIRDSIKTQERVRFVYHCWMPFRNLGGNGFRIPAVPYGEIPTLTLIPLVSITDKLIDSRKEPRNNKYVPSVVLFDQDIDSSITDLIMKFADRSLISVPSLDCTLSEAEFVMNIFDAVMEGFTGGLLQDLPEFFNTKSPAAEQLEVGKKRIKTTAYEQLDILYRSGKVSTEWYEKFQEAFRYFGQSAVTAHMAALSPSNGVLPRTIAAINERNKASFDETDNWLRKQFPNFNTDTLISKSKENDSITKLVDLLASRMTPAEAQQPIIDATKFIESLTDDQITQLFAARGLSVTQAAVDILAGGEGNAASAKTAESEAASIKVSDSDETKDSSSESLEPEKKEDLGGDVPAKPPVEPVYPQPTVAEEPWDGKCIAINVTSGNKCSRTAAPDSKYCLLPAHQAQGE